MTALELVQSTATRKMAQCKCGSYPQCEQCVLMRLVLRLTATISRTQRDIIQSAANELAASKEGADA